MGELLGEGLQLSSCDVCSQTSPCRKARHPQASVPTPSHQEMLSSAMAPKPESTPLNARNLGRMLPVMSKDQTPPSARGSAYGVDCGSLYFHRRKLFGGNSKARLGGQASRSGNRQPEGQVVALPFI